MIGSGLFVIFGLVWVQAAGQLEKQPANVLFFLFFGFYLELIEHIEHFGPSFLIEFKLEFRLLVLFELLKRGSFENIIAKLIRYGFQLILIRRIYCNISF